MGSRKDVSVRKVYIRGPRPEYYPQDIPIWVTMVFPSPKGIEEYLKRYFSMNSGWKH